MDWLKDKNGNLIVYAVTGWDLFQPFGIYCGLRVHYTKSIDALEQGMHETLPLILMPDQARELAQRLIELADIAQSPPTKNDAIQ